MGEFSGGGGPRGVEDPDSLGTGSARARRRLPPELNPRLVVDTCCMLCVTSGARRCEDSSLRFSSLRRTSKDFPNHRTPGGAMRGDRLGWRGRGGGWAQGWAWSALGGGGGKRKRTRTSLTVSV